MTPLFARNNDISCSKTYEECGLRLKPLLLSGNSEEQIPIPFINAPAVLQGKVKQIPKAISLVNALQELWLSDYIMNTDKGDIWVSYEKLYNITDQQVWNVIELPELVDVGINLKSSGAVGHPGFHIKYGFVHPDYGQINSQFRRDGIFVKTINTNFILPYAKYELLKYIDQHPKDNIDEQTQYLAKVKKMAIQSKASMDQYLANEEYIFPEAINISLQKNSKSDVEILANLEGVPDGLQESIFEASERGKFAHTDINREGFRTRVILPPQIRKEIKAITRKKRITGSDVPKFTENPVSYMPEIDSLSIEDFSERVKELSILTYRAQPFIRARESQKQGWFDFDIGIEIRPVNMDSINPDSDDISEGYQSDSSLTEEEFRELLEKAKINGEDYVQHPKTGDWIHIDYAQGLDFIKAHENMKESFGSGPIDAARLPYVLKIFENIKALEYDTTTLGIKKKLVDNDLFDDRNPKPILEHVVLYEFQRDGYRWMRVLKNGSFGGLLADDMGLGKTLQVITFLAFLYERGELRNTIVIAPLTLIENWTNEIWKFTNGLGKIYVHHGIGRIRDKDSFEEFDIVMTTYETLVRDQILLGQVNWKVVILDEAQKIKNTTAMASNVAKALKADARFALTGTPVENGLNELWCIMDFVQPGLLGSYSEFRKIYELPIQKASLPMSELEVLTEQLQEKIKPVYLRRTKEEKLPGLPVKEDVKTSVELGSLQSNLYTETIRRYKRKKINFFSALSDLMQICSHPAIVSGNLSDNRKLLEDCPKLVYTLSLLDEIKQKQEKAIIFTKYRTMQNILCKVINEKFRLWPLIINGEIVGNRIGVVKDFERVEGFNVIILSPRAAGIGLNIVGANHVIHYTREWNPAVENQATDRVYRMGQLKDVKVYYPIGTSSNGKTVEQRLDELLEEKKDLIRKVIVPHERLTITEKDFEGIF